MKGPQLSACKGKGLRKENSPRWGGEKHSASAMCSGDACIINAKRRAHVRKKPITEGGGVGPRGGPACNYHRWQQRAWEKEPLDRRKGGGGSLRGVGKKKVATSRKKSARKFIQMRAHSFPNRGVILRNCSRRWGERSAGEKK